MVTSLARSKQFLALIRATGLESRGDTPAQEGAARMVWDLLLNGKIEFPDGRQLEIDSAEEWLEMFWRLQESFDGKPGTRVEPGSTLPVGALEEGSVSIEVWKKQVATVQHAVGQIEDFYGESST